MSHSPRSPSASTAPLRSPTNDSTTAAKAGRWIWLIVAFLVGVLLGQWIMAWTLKPESFSFPTYTIVVPPMTPDA